MCLAEGVSRDPETVDPEVAPRGDLMVRSRRISVKLAFISSGPARLSEQQQTWHAAHNFAVDFIQRRCCVAPPGNGVQPESAAISAVALAKLKWLALAWETAEIVERITANIGATVCGISLIPIPRHQLW